MSTERRDGDERKENTHINLLYLIVIPDLFFDPHDSNDMKVRRVNDSQDRREDFRVWS